jgi:hypothetical protein
VSLTTISHKKGRVYHRHFDHDEARRLRAEGLWTYSRLAEHFGVSEAAVMRVCNPEFRARMDARLKEFVWRNKREPCKGECGRLVWMMTKGRSGYCQSCLGERRVAADVREGELRWTQCRQWKPDSEFGHNKNKARRGLGPRTRSRMRMCMALDRRRPRVYSRTHG